MKKKNLLWKIAKKKRTQIINHPNFKTKDKKYQFKIYNINCNKDWNNSDLNNADLNFGRCLKRSKLKRKCLKKSSSGISKCLKRNKQKENV